MRKARAALVVAVLAATGLAWRIFSQSPAPPQVASPGVLSFLIILGVQGGSGATWDGSITATGAAIVDLRGWRFSGTDSITGNSWKAVNHLLSTGPSATNTYQENGIIVTVTDTGNPVRFDVHTAMGDFSFLSTDVPFGKPAHPLSSRVLVEQTASTLPLTTSVEDEDFPAAAQAGDYVYVSYTRFVHGDRSLAATIGTQTAITDFSYLARPTGGDQVLLMRYSKSQRTWTGPYVITNPGEDIMRTAVAVDWQGRAWVFYSAQRKSNFDIFARVVDAVGSVGPEIRLTTDPGVDLNPVAATDASGRVWVAWQGFRNNNLEVLAAAQTADGFSPEAAISFSPASDWDPAIAASRDGQVAIAWDTYDKGDYDVYVRRVRFTGAVTGDDPIPIATGPDFEARPSLAYDPLNRLWIAYETSGPKWGKDWSAHDTTGIALYQNHSIQVRCLNGNDLYATADDVARVLPGPPGSFLFSPVAQTTPVVQPDPSLAGKRTPNNDPAAPASPKNSFPRMATDGDGVVYLAYRRPFGVAVSTSSATGQSVGSIWGEEMVYFDGARWNGPGTFAASDGLLDNRPAITALAPGRLLIAQATDHRLSPALGGTAQSDRVHSDIDALEVPIARTVQPAQLRLLPPQTVSAPASDATAEANTVDLMRSYRPTINGQRLQLVRGEFHRHTEISFDGKNDGPLVDAYRYAIDAAGLDWVGCCDHDNGGAREYSWWIEQKYTDAFLLGTRFVPMFNYERSVNYPEGHRNVLFTQRGVRPLPRLPLSARTDYRPAPDTAMLYRYLQFFKGQTASHTSATSMGTDWRNNDPALETSVEIYQGDRQNYEMPGAPRANTPDDSIGGYEPLGYVYLALGVGYQFGFEASSDHISTHASYSNIWVATPTRQGILDALAKRRVYGSTDAILADFRSGTHFMGDVFTTSTPPVFSVKLWGTNSFQNVSVIKDNNVVYSTSGDRVIAFTWADTTAQKGKTSYYYVRGLQSDGQIVWVTPMWVTLQ
jgi:hypothetical protein